MPVYKDDKTNTWRAVFRYTDWTGEKKQTQKRGFITQKAAKAWEKEEMLKLQGACNMTFDSFVELYFESLSGKLKLNTINTKRHIFETKILPYFADKKINEIRATDIINWQNKLIKAKYENGKPFSQTYLKTIHNQMSAILNFAVKYYGLKENVARKAGAMGKKESDREMLIWTKDEYMRFAEAKMEEPMHYYAFELLYWCGIREGELLALTPSDFDFNKRTLRINKSYQRINGCDIITEPKTPKSNRIIKMPSFLCDEMQDYIGMHYGAEKDTRLFPISKTALYRAMKTGCEKAGVKKIRIHDLRHPYVKHTTKIFSLRLMDFQAQAYPDARRKTRGACQLLRVGQSRSPVRPLCNRKRFSCLPPQSKMSWILYAISMRLSGYTSTRSISSSASSVVSVSASKIALDASFRLSCRACSSCFCFACANTAA